MKEMTMATTEQAPDYPNLKPKLYLIGFFVTLVALAGIWFGWSMVAADYEREQQAWQEKLNLIAESRAAELTTWVENRFSELRNLANNPSLPLYVMELQAMPETAAADNASSEKAYLRNLLIFTAEHSGFGKMSPPSAIPANIPQESSGGLAVLSNDGSIIVSTALAPAVKDLMVSSLSTSPAGQETFIRITEAADGHKYMGFSLPVYAIQAEHTPETQIGRVIGISEVGADLFALLKHPGTTEKTLETILLRAREGNIDYLSPLQDNTGEGKVLAQTAKLAEAELVATPGGFIVSGTDYRGKKVMETSRSIARTPWVLVTKIDRSEALAASSRRRASIIFNCVLIIAVVVLAMLAVWRHVYGKQSKMLSDYFKRMAAKSQAQERMLRLATDHLPESIYIVDKAKTLRFANRRAEEAVGVSEGQMAGKQLADVEGPVRAEAIEPLCATALEEKRVIYDVQNEHNNTKIIRSAFVPIEHIPMAELPEPTPGVLVVEQDISEVVQSREARADTLKKLVQMLVKLVDRRDPFAANHSLLVSELSAKVAADMGLSVVTQEATRMAASLMNIGKIIIPTELLTKTASLSAEEKRTIRESMDIAAKLIEGIRFDGPVVETLKEWQEKWDGSGPLGLKEEAISLPARIIAAANAFIGMISPRSWRDALPIEAASAYLLEHAGKEFDRKVVIALIYHVENQHGREWIEQIVSSNKMSGNSLS